MTKRTTTTTTTLATAKPANWKERPTDGWWLELAIDNLRAVMRPVEMPLAERRERLATAAQYLDEIRLRDLAKTVRAVIAGAHSSILDQMLAEAFSEEIEAEYRRWVEVDANMRRWSQASQAEE